MIVTELTREEDWTRESVQVTRSFLCDPASQVDLLLAKLLGQVVLVGNRYVTTIPHRDPIRPECFCVSAKVKPFDVLNSPGNVPNGMAIVDAKNFSGVAAVQAVYKTLDYQLKEQNPNSNEKDEKEIASEAFDFGARQLTLPNAYFATCSGSDKVLLAQEGQQLTKTLPTVEMQLVRHFSANLPYKAITQLCGRVNGTLSGGTVSGAFAVGKRSWEAETVRFDGLHSMRKFTTKSPPLYELTYKFAINPIYDRIDDSCSALGPPTDFPPQGYVGWNRIFRPKTGLWTRVKHFKDDTRFIYQLDGEITQTLGGRTVTGFDLLFHPAAT
jgi:hypothetical protein